MFDIRNNDDLRIAYLLVHMYEEENRRADHVVDLKRKIRSYIKKEMEPDRRLVGGDWDWYTVLITFPDFIETRDEAEEWFEANEKIEYRPTYYDCTGQLFTCYHYIFQRNGRWMCYHKINRDV